MQLAKRATKSLARSPVNTADSGIFVFESIEGISTYNMLLFPGTMELKMSLEYLNKIINLNSFILNEKTHKIIKSNCNKTI